MTSLLFALMAAAMGFAWNGHRRTGLAVYALATLLGLAWFGHHLTDPLNLDF